MNPPLMLATILLIFTNCFAEEEYEIYAPPDSDHSLNNQPVISEGGMNRNQTMFEMEEDHERLCGLEGRLLKEKGNYLVQCRSDSECLPPSQCNFASGYCCMMALNQDPPPVGCPIGTRPLRNSSGELSCDPSNPNSCPGGALCYLDSLTQQRRCCASDPGQGCPSGSRAILTSFKTDSPLLCTPGRSLCPEGGICQWSHLIDRYQCCQPDNGCPRHQTPLRDDTDMPKSCQPGGAPCPGGAGCRFNFWTASHQCCKIDTSNLCPAGQVPYLSTNDASPTPCDSDADCPSNFFCNDNHLCCGQPGECPGPHSALKDVYGRVTACSVRNGNVCPLDSKCLTTSILNQKLCCVKEEYKCPGFSKPFPDSQQPIFCEIGLENICPEGQCMPSSAKGITICCKSTIAPPSPQIPAITIIPNPCPNGWILNDNQITYCHPSAQSSFCPGYSSCLRSTAVKQQFVCCIPAGRFNLQCTGPQCPYLLD